MLLILVGTSVTFNDEMRPEMHGAGPADGFGALAPAMGAVIMVVTTVREINRANLRLKGGEVAGRLLS